MAERRRRRKLTNNSGSDEGSDESEDEKKITKSGSEVGDSEYESADEEELGEEEEELILVQDSGGLDDENKQLDDDEDRKNPQYIPKRGTFYEHDDRTAEGADDLETTQESEEIRSEADVTGSKKDLTTSGKKKVWKEDDKWSHDKFIDYEQSPKTREELITIYGYDIRNEEGPPRARRRRRYGRGPNKYTRNWEDLDAYSKPSRGSPVPRGGGGRGNRRVPENTEEEFPALGSHHHNISDGEHEHIQNEKYMHKSEREQSHHYDHKSSTDHLENHHYRDHPKNHTDEGRGRGRARGRGGSGGRGGQHKDSNRGHESNNTGRGSSRGGGGQQFRPQHISNREQLQEITAELKNVNIGNNQQHHHQQQQQQPRDEQQQQQHHHNNHQQHRGRGRGGGGRGSVPPRMQDASSVNAGSNRGVSNNAGDGNSEGIGGSSRPKRYSSQRQRSIPDQPGSPYQGQHQGGYIDQVHDKGYGGFEGANNSTRSNSSLSGQQQQPNFVPGPAAYTQGPNNFPAEAPFLGRPPAPRMFSPQPGPGPHMIPPVVAGSPVGVGGGVPRVVGPPGVGGPPPGVAGPPVGVPTVGGPPVTGPPFLPAENLISYVGPPPPHPGPPHLGPHPAAAPFAGPPPPQFPPFQGYPPGPTSQPQEIYSNGVTYYNTQNQQVVPRVSIPLQKRPKAAIPIVPPPDTGSTNSIDQGSNSNDQDIETNDLQYESNLIESQEFIPAEQSQETVKDDVSPAGQIKEELNGVEQDKKQIDLPSTEKLKVQGQESSNEKKEIKENIIYNEKESLDEKLKDDTNIKESEIKEKVIAEKDIKTTLAVSGEKITEDKTCAAGENREAEVLVDTPVAAS